MVIFVPDIVCASIHKYCRKKKVKRCKSKKSHVINNLALDIHTLKSLFCSWYCLPKQVAFSMQHIRQRPLHFG